jgi:hypothetical protein
MFSKVLTVNKIKHPEKGGKRYKMEGPKLWQKEKTTTLVDHKVNMNKSSTEIPQSQKTY